MSMISIVISAVLMFSLLSSDIFKNDAVADVKLYNAGVKLTEIKDDFLNIFSDNKSINNEKRKIENPLPQVYIGGYPIGLKLYADGVVIVGTEAVDTEKGVINTAEKAGLKVGDLIKKVNGIKVQSNAQISSIIEKSAGQELIIEAERKGRTFEVSFEAAFSKSEQKYKAGIWIRDSSAGIGTVTFCTKDGGFASLGHAVCDIDTKETIPISQGECTKANLTGYIRGGNGSAGELCGFLENKRTGVIFSNDSLGVYGCFDVLPENRALYEIASSSEIETGAAEIITTIENGITESYSVIIEKIDAKSTENKNLIIRITDRKLIEKTGGIIQGMSGSPIIQNGKLIGAVTHVFLNDATGGFGVFAETMLRELEKNISDRRFE